MKIFNRAIFTSMVFVCLIANIITSCRDAMTADSRTPSATAKLDSIADAMTDLEPWAIATCEQEMRQATDSLTFYDYLTVKARHFVFTDTPESTLVYTDRLNKFLDTQPTTRRINGMRARARAIEASYYYLLKKDLHKVIELEKQAFDCAEQGDIDSKLPDLAANLADAYEMANDMSSASMWYRKALFLVDSLGLPPERNVTLYLGLAQIYTNARDFTTARKYYQLSDSQFDKMKPNMQTYFLNNYGNYLYFTADYKAARNMFLRMKQHLESHGCDDTFDMRLCKINLADVMLNLGKADSALALVNEVEQFFKDNKVLPALYYANTIRLGIAAKTDNTSEAQRIIKSGDDTISVENSMKRIRNRYLRDYYLSQGDYRNAYKHLETEKAMNDSAISTEQKYNASEIIHKLTEDTLKLHHKLELEEKNAEVTKSRVSVAMLLTIAVALAFAVSYIVAVGRKRKLQTHLELVQLKMANARQRISPHFIFNLLNADLAKVSSEEANRLLEISKLMRYSLALVHEPYVTVAEEIAFVNQYISLNATLLGDTFHYYYTPADDHAMEEIMIPPMMVQILVENAIKHGIKNNEGDKILRLMVDIGSEKTVITVEDNGPGMNMTKKSTNSSHNGLYIIRHTVNYINQHNRNKNHMSFRIANVMDDNGKVAGCRAEIEIPRGIKYAVMGVNERF